MEKNILYSVHSEFNSLFERWFSLLIENNVLQMSLDEEYSPKIIQNGYDIEYEYLSGGEKTAGALAYRLALNQVINDLNTGIKTKDLLILDEPTDGFSSEQLERLKVLMEEIKIPQIIIVSHEAQVESFVDSIIRFEKQNHQTRVY
jgi:exonuclease SbcC